MRAAYYESTGSPDVVRVGDLPTPVPAPGQVRVRVHAAALNPVDAYLRAGLVTMPLPFPFVTGSDFAGTVDVVGAGVTGFAAGDRVWGSNQGLLGRPGTFAEFVCPPAEFVYPLPDGVPFEATAAAALTGISAHLGLFRRARLAAGETVFVNGGTGGVGSMVVQMARAVGARVVCTVGSAGKAEVVKRLGADAVLDYKADDVTAGVLAFTGGAGVNVYYETQPPADLDAVVARTAADGRVVVMAGRTARPVLPNGPFYVKGLSLVGFAMFNSPPAEQRACAADIGRWLAEGKLTPLIGRTFPLAEAAAAHRLQDDNTLGKAGTLAGKIVVVPGS